jgi:precorrin-6A synthase
MSGFAKWSRWIRRGCGRLRLVRELLLVGMGPGHPDQVTVQAVNALNRADVFFRIDKGDGKSGLNAARAEILRRHVAGG